MVVLLLSTYQIIKKPSKSALSELIRFCGREVAARLLVLMPSMRLCRIAISLLEPDAAMVSKRGDKDGNFTPTQKLSIKQDKD